MSSIVHPSANESAIGGSINVPVNLASGLPSISIPLMGISDGGISQNVTLKYSANGIKVNERSGTVGLKWMLDAGPSLSRTIYGIADETYNKGWLDHCTNLPYIDSENHSTSTALDLYHYAENEYDTRPDMFNLVISGFSGKFYFDSNGNAQTIPNSNVKITDLGNLSSFLIVDENGIEYLFGGGLTTKETVEFSNNCDQGIAATIKLAVTAWKIERIKNPMTGDQINYGYTTFETNYTENDIREILKVLPVSLIGIVSGEDIPWEIYWQLISGPHDLKAYGVHRLGTIPNTCSAIPQFLQCSNTIKRKVSAISYIAVNMGEQALVFTHSPSISTVEGGEILTKIEHQVDGTTSSFCNLTYSTYSSGRLKLDAVSFGSPTNSSLKRYDLEYNEDIPMPMLNSKRKDVFGYFNNKIFNFSSVSTPEVINLDVAEGADRRLSESHIQVGMLTKITYPTGGFTSFEYEPNYGRYKVPNQLVNEVFEDQNRYQFGTVSYQYGDPVSTHPTLGFGFSEHEIDLSIGSTAYKMLSINMVQISNQNYQGSQISSIRLLDENDNPALDLLTNQHLAWSGNSAGKKMLKLARGKYKLLVQRPITTDKVIISYSFYDPLPNPLGFIQKGDSSIINVYAGGLRIKAINQSDGSDVVRKEYSYELDSIAASSSLLPKFPALHSYQKSADQCPSIKFHSDAFDAYHGSLSSHVVYERVTERIISPEDNGHVVNYFTGYRKFPDFYVDSAQYYTPLTKMMHRRGLLVRTEVYDGLDRILRTNDIEYAFSRETNLNNTENRYYNLGFRMALPDPVKHNSKFHVGNYKLISEWVYPIKSKVSIYDPITGHQNSTISKLFYDNPVHSKPTEIVRYLESGKLELTKLSYAHDFDVSPLSTDERLVAIKKFQTHNQFNQVVEQAHFQGRDYRLNLVSSSRTDFQKLVNVETSRSFGIPKESLSWLPNVEVPLENFQLAHELSNPNTFQAQSEYETEVLFDHYDDRLKLTQMHGLNDQPVSYLWDKEGERLLASLGNGNKESFWYFGFEDYEQIHPAIAASQITANNLTVSGNKVYQMNAGDDISLDLTEEGSYLLDYFAINPLSIIASSNITISNTVAEPIRNLPNGLKHYRHKFTVVLASGGSAPYQIQLESSSTQILDELRMHKQEASLTSFIYKEDKALSHVFDENLRQAEYNYDDFGRLHLTKDHMGFVRTRYDYQYKNQ